MTFIDEHTGVGFEALSGYTFYFDDEQSTNIYGQKRIFFISSKSTITCSVSDNDIFFLYDMSAINEDTINQLSTIKKQTLTLSGRSQGNNYLYCLNIGCISDTQGEFIDDLIIDSVNYNISADFYTQREEMEILLHNQGVDLHKDIVRSLYETNVHDQAIDWVVLNRKYKELLLNIVDIVYKKGSYQSLISSLNWFEWGDLVLLKEYWSTPTIDIKHEKDLTVIYTSVLQEMMAMFRKTTFISLTLPVQENSGEYEFENKELTVPILQDIEFDWSVEDIKLKMTLLGNFFSSYFMPIHMDLIFSSIQNIVYTTTNKNKLLYTNIHREDNRIDDRYVVKFNDINSIQYLKDIYCSAKEDTIAVSKDKRLGVISMNKVKKTDTIDDYVKINSYIGLGCRIHVSCCIKSILNDDNNIFNKLYIVAQDSSLKRVLEVPVEMNIGDEYEFDLFIGTLGKNIINVNFISIDGTVISKSIIINLIAPAVNNFTATRMRRFNDVEEFLNKNIYHYSFTNTFVETEPTHDYPSYIVKAYEHLYGGEDTDIRIRMYYPDSYSNYICACRVPLNGEVYLYKDKNDGNGFVLPSEDQKRKYTLNELIALLKTEITNGWMYSIISRETYDIIYIFNIYRNTEYQYAPRTEITDSNYKCDSDKKIVFFNEYRFIPQLWTKEDDESKTLYNLTYEDGLVMLCPENILSANKDRISWTIRNEGSRNEGYIQGIINPLIVANNDKNDTSKGIYSVTLSTYYGSTKLSSEIKSLYRIV